MTVAYLFDPVKQFVSRNGIPLAGGFLNVFIGESQEPADTFSDADGKVLNPKKIPIDSAGRALGVFVDDSKLYTLKAYNAGGQLQFSIYPVSPSGGSGGGSGNSYYYPGDEYIYIDQDAREISLHNTKAIRGDEETIKMEDTQDAIILHVNPDIIGDEVHIAAGEHTSVDYDSDSNTFTVNAEYAGSDTVEIDSDGVVSGKYKGGYGIEIAGNTIKKTHHKLMATNSVKYNYCKVFDFTWNRTYGRGLCVFTATNYGGDHVTYAVSLTRTVNADYTIAWPYVVSASPYMAQNGFVESIEIREEGDRIIGYLKLRNFKQSQFWLDWEGSSEAGVVSFTPQLTNSPEGTIVQTKSVSASDVFYSQADADDKFQKKLIQGEGIILDSDGNISLDESVIPDGNNVFIATYGTTTYDDIKAAIDAGKAVIVKDGRIQYTVVSNAVDLWSSPAIFFGAILDQYAAGFPQRALISVRNIEGQGTKWDRISNSTLALSDKLPIVATYGSTSYSTINNAINGDRVVVLKKTNSTEDVDWAVYGGYNSYTDKTEHYFFGIATDGQRYVYKVDNSNNWTASAIDDSMFQKKLTAGDAILIDSDNVISNGSPVKFSSTIGNPDLSPCSTNVVAQRNRNHLTYTKMSFVNQYGNTGAFVLIPHDLGEGYLYISDNYISVKAIDAPAVVSGTATDKSWTNTIYQTPVALDWTFTLAAGKLLDINVNACVYQTGQTSTPLYRMELVDSSNNVKTYFSWVPREMDASETDPDRSTLNGRLVWKNSTSASVTLSLRISDKDQAPTGTTQLKSIRIDGVVR